MARPNRWSEVLRAVARSADNESVVMSQEEGDRLRKRFNVLARKAEAFFKEAGGESWNAWRIADQNWALLSAEQKASADGLDKRDLERFAKLGRTMDAALRFEPFRSNKIGHLASEVFREAYEEARELLELLPRKGPWEPPVAVRGPFSRSRR